MEKTRLILYWVATGLLAFGMLGSAIAQVFRARDMVDIIVHLGHPVYLMPMLGIWKILGVAAILIPRYKLVKEWAYAGLFFTMTGAFVSHLACGDGVKETIGAFMQTIFIILSWYFRPPSRKLLLS